MTTFFNFIILFVTRQAQLQTHLLTGLQAVQLFEQEGTTPNAAND